MAAVEQEPQPIRMLKVPEPLRETLNCEFAAEALAVDIVVAPPKPPSREPMILVKMPLTDQTAAVRSISLEQLDKLVQVAQMVSFNVRGAMSEKAKRRIIV